MTGSGKTRKEGPREMSLGERLQLALRMFVDGERLMRQNLRRRHPTASEGEIEGALVAWVRTRPGAEAGDCPGRLRPSAE